MSSRDTISNLWICAVDFRTRRIGSCCSDICERVWACVCVYVCVFCVCACGCVLCVFLLSQTLQFHAVSLSSNTSSTIALPSAIRTLRFGGMADKREKVQNMSARKSKGGIHTQKDRHENARSDKNEQTKQRSTKDSLKSTSSHYVTQRHTHPKEHSITAMLHVLIVMEFNQSAYTVRAHTSWYAIAEIAWNNCVICYIFAHRRMRTYTYLYSYSMDAYLMCQNTGQGCDEQTLLVAWIRMEKRNMSAWL